MSAPPRDTGKANQSPVGDDRDYDDAEKGLYDSFEKLPVAPTSTHSTDDDGQKKDLVIETYLYPTSPIHEGLTPPPAALSPTSPRLSLAWPKGSSGQDAEKPAAKKLTAPKKISRWIKFQLWFNTYRKMFTLVTVLNTVGIIMAVLGKFPYAYNNIGALVLGNLLGAVLFRNELFLRFLYIVAIYGLRGWAPLWLKYGATSFLQHVGGIHSGTALSGAGWLIFMIVDILRNHTRQHAAVMVSGVITTVLVIISIISAIPWVRNNNHNTFERLHRFIGWSGIATTWVFVILGNFYDIKHAEWRVDAANLLSAQQFWFAVFITVFVSIPWFTVRHVEVEVEIPSPKVAVLKFKRGMQQGLLGRVGRGGRGGSMMEYHAFGIISEGVESDCHYMICGVQGDFTRELVKNPPKMVWTRELKFAGVGHASAMFKRGIRICTGTGIGAALSTCIQSEDWFLIWIGSDQEKTFGPTISALIHNNIPPERRILWDSKERGGRPDAVQLLKETWVSFGAEVIFITSNMQGNDEMMQGCREAGLHAFGTLWDF